TRQKCLPALDSTEDGRVRRRDDGYAFENRRRERSVAIGADLAGAIEHRPHARIDRTLWCLLFVPVRPILVLPPRLTVLTSRKGPAFELLRNGGTMSLWTDFNRKFNMFGRLALTIAVGS